MSFKKLTLGLLLASGCMAVAQAPESIKGVTIAPHPLKEFVPVTGAVLRKPDANDWLMMRAIMRAMASRPWIRSTRPM